MIFIILQGCCASKNKKSKDPVVVTFFGATGEVGGNVIGPFFEALDDGRIQELRVATRDTESDAIQKFIGQGAKVSDTIVEPDRNKIIYHAKMEQLLCESEIEIEIVGLPSELWRQDVSGRLSLGDFHCRFLYGHWPGYSRGE